MEKKNIYQKLFEFKQKEIVLKKDTEWHWYKYTELSQIQQTLNPIFKDLKLLVTHSVKDNEVVTQIRDIESDTFVESSIQIWKVETSRKQNFVDKNWKDIETFDFNDKDPQWVWSIISYHRRYNLLALLDLEQKDDDGKWGSNRAKTKDYWDVKYYKLQDWDIDLWNWKIYWRKIYLDWEERVLTDATIEFLKKSEKYVELPPKA